MMVKKFKRVMCLLMALSLLSIGLANPVPVLAAQSNQQMESYIEGYSTSEVEKYVDESGSVVIQVTNVEYGINDVLVLENDTKNIVLNGEIVGYFSPTQDVDSSPITNSTTPSKASATWKYLDTHEYTITATGAGIASAVLAILSGLMGGAAAASIIAGLSAFVGASTVGGTLTVKIWDRTLGTQYYQKYSVKFTTSTGEVWGPVETIQAL